MPRAKATTASGTETGALAGGGRSHASSGSYRRAPDKVIETLALRVLYSHGGSVETQEQLYRELVEQLHWEKPDLRVSPPRMRQVLLASKRIHIEIRYATKMLTEPLSTCPVCRAPVAEIRNHTLEGESVVSGFRCTRCPFWTPLRRRVPARYVFRAGA